MPRTALVRRMLAATEPVITVVAPPGYGKTTLLSQWAEQVDPPSAWVSCDPLDNDPGTLWNAIVAALDVVEPVSPYAARLVAAYGGGIRIVYGLMRHLAQTSGPRRLVLDNVEHVTSAESRAGLAELLLRLPEGWQVAMASRTQPPPPVARLRANRLVLELGPAELAMSDGEAAALIEGAGVQATALELDVLVSATEGWPVGLYLGALAMRAGTPSAGVAFTGDDRHVADYLRSELLARLTPDQADFMVRTSVLERLSGPLCDTILEQTGSGRTLEELESLNLLVVPLDRHREWYRYHHLLREYLATELRLREREERVGLHRRAVAWFAEHGMPEAAVAHAQAADDVDLMATLVLRFMHPMWATGRIETVGRWMEWLRERPATGGLRAAVASFGSMIFALLGQVGEAERWGDLADGLPAEGSLPDGTTVAAAVAVGRASRAQHGLAQMRADSQAALDGLSPTNAYRAGMLYLQALTHLFGGDQAQGIDVLVHATDVAEGFEAKPLLASCIAQRGLVAMDHGDWPLATELTGRALALIEDGATAGYSSSALTMAAAARSAARRGDIPAARRLARRAAVLRPMQTYARPVTSVQSLVELARVYLALGDFSGADVVLAQATEIIRQCPDLGTLPKLVDDLTARVHQVSGASTGATALTSAELRLVPVLPTHLSLPQIAERLSLSRHTVKSQTVSLYRKLGVSSRAEAVSRIQQLGLDA